MCGERQQVGSPPSKPRASPRGFFNAPHLGDRPCPWHPAIMPTPFDPLAWLASKDTEAFLDPAGQVRLRFGQFVRQEDRQRIRRVIERWYLPVLRLQLDVEPGTRPRSVYQLLASGKLKIVEGRYRITAGG